MLRRLFQCFGVRTQRNLVFNLDSTEVLVDVTTIDANNPLNYFLRGSGLFPLHFRGATTVLAAKKKWDKYRFMRRGPNQQVFPLKYRVDGAIVLANSLSSSFPRFLLLLIGFHAISGLTESRLLIRNVLRSTSKRHVFGPLAPQNLFHFEPYYGQHLDSLVDTLP